MIKFLAKYSTLSVFKNMRCVENLHITSTTTTETKKQRTWFKIHFTQLKKKKKNQKIYG
jgi:hypothetical protein